MQTGFRLRLRITATGLTLIANGIANIGAVPTLIATGAGQVMAHYGLVQPLSQAGYYETDHHKRLLKDVRDSILEGRLIVVHGIIGSGSPGR